MDRKLGSHRRQKALHRPARWCWVGRSPVQVGEQERQRTAGPLWQDSFPWQWGSNAPQHWALAAVWILFITKSCVHQMNERPWLASCRSWFKPQRVREKQLQGLCWALAPLQAPSSVWSHRGTLSPSPCWKGVCWWYRIYGYSPSQFESLCSQSHSGWVSRESLGSRMGQWLQMAPIPQPVSCGQELRPGWKQELMDFQCTGQQRPPFKKVSELLKNWFSQPPHLDISSP